MSADNAPPTDEQVEEFRLLVVALRADLMKVFSGKDQGACVAVCFQIIYEQMQDVQLADSSLEFVHQNLIALHDLVHTIQAHRLLMAAQLAVQVPPEEEMPAPTPSAPPGHTLH